MSQLSVAVTGPNVLLFLPWQGQIGCSAGQLARSQHVGSFQSCASEGQNEVNLAAVRDAEKKRYPWNVEGGEAGSEATRKPGERTQEGGGTRREGKSTAMLRTQHYRGISFEGTGHGFPGKGQKVTLMILGVWGHGVRVAGPHHHVQRLRMLLGPFNLVAWAGRGGGCGGHQKPTPCN